ncbi:sugar-binding transcriptional regulator [Oceanobacillus polygoni]|uniref:Deoxyribonucleoside regulator n=1 Tax=Oceanobacillus polygoni TaxID=1235259 RepID=A0A9X0YWQ7_9BACI|nr:sugar-binding transcriptional regulator [Oceanobacillus polygoni]MBP2079446.1 deoxyribonucleoside regulator [Oceanobacillus polygoni]
MSVKDHQVLRVAELYYKQEMGQQEISKMLGVSRPTVSRMIQEAKRRGIVSININTPVELDYKLSDQIKNKFNLKDVLVVKTDDENADETLKRVGYVASRFLLGLLKINDLIGISWGRTIKHVVDSITETDLTDVDVIQLVGSLGSGNPAIDGPELAYKLAERFKGSYKYINSPAVVSDEQVKNALLNQRQIQEVLQVAENCDIVLMGLGSLSEENSSLHRSGYLDEKKRREYLEKGAVGHILAQMVDEKGEMIKLPANYVIGVPLDSLKKKKWSIGVVAHSFKNDITLAAIRGEYINSLVIDEFTANKILKV